MVPKRTALMLLAPALLAFGCSSSLDPVVCTDEARPGIVLQVVDPISAAPILTGVTVTFQDGDYTETYTSASAPSGTFSGAYERPGTYVVAAAKDGFETWIRTGVEVTADQCHVKTVQLQAVLQPLSGS
ncbi:MAG: carboxypeptidase-like regulatory domain-containing protein [Gemmatimonadota bacterium]|jgi:hypothetical protein